MAVFLALAFVAWALASALTLALALQDASWRRCHF
jgi:hypothetical protein